MLQMEDLPPEEESLIYMYYREDEKIRSINICDDVYAKVMK